MKRLIPSTASVFLFVAVLAGLHVARQEALAAQSFTFAHQQYVQQVQVVAALTLNNGDKIHHLIDLSNSPAVAGAALTDAEIQAFGPLFQSMTAAQIAAVKTDLAAVQAVLDGPSSYGSGQTVRQILSATIVGLP